MRLSEQEKSKLGATKLNLMEEAIEKNETMAFSHPYYSEFKEQCKRTLSIGNEREIECLWEELLKGYQEQPQRVAKARTDAKDIRDYLGRINDNGYFKGFVAKITQLSPEALLVPRGEKLALWTGGYAVSEEAQKLGFCTLEKTKLGGIMNTLRVSGNWDREEALWNLLSAEFVKQYGDTPVHIYFRNVDELCVLFQQEIPMLMKKSPAITVIWHPLVNSGTQISEIGYLKAKKETIKINLSKTNHVFFCQSNELETYKNAFWALAEGLHTSSPQANKYVLEHFRSKDFHPIYAPFARGEEADSGKFVNDFLHKFWI